MKEKEDFDFVKGDVDDAVSGVEILEVTLKAKGSIDWDSIMYSLSTALAHQEIRDVMPLESKNSFANLIEKISKAFKSEEGKIAKQYGTGFAHKLRRVLREISTQINK